ncbi:carbohydrate ABC transporter permease [Lederbergia citri]|uniref:Sugar ABC transporter permease n=1 Tax=Lederbergia citri TaxID=2833580 RepID=A0A942TIX5_9BACI|nr:sugar ABC transporter permease [Lederbergia citri]MBS4197611.1 sugar ABC transporter permease [Lederbergia citri]
MENTFKNTMVGLLFLSPALITFGIFIAEPLVHAIVLIFTKYNVISPAKFVGMANIKTFFEDDRLRLIYWNTFKFVIILVPMHMIFGLLLAVGVTKVISNKWKYFYRTIFYFPVLVTTASVAIAWQFMFNYDFGVLNYILNLLGIDSINWLTSPTWVYLSVAIFSLWKFVGNGFLYYLIGLQAIPKTFYEAAEIDGATSVQSFFRITIPLLTPTIFFVFITTMIGAIQIFDEPYLITGGGPLDASRTITLYIYEVAFQNHEMGYASTLAVSLFLIILAVTIFQFKMSDKWVNYDNE